MSYISLLNKFWDKRGELDITSIDTDLYLFLVHRCNKLRWQSPFYLPTKDIQDALNLSRKTIVNARKKLENVGLIKFQQGETNGKFARYFLCECVSQSNTLSTECVSQSNTLAKENTPTPLKENIYIQDNLSLRHGESEKKITIEKLREYFSGEIVMEGQMKNNCIYDVRTYLVLCEEVLNDFVATKDDNFKFDSDAKRHFINLLRIKNQQKNANNVKDNAVKRRTTDVSASGADEYGGSF